MHDFIFLKTFFALFGGNKILFFVGQKDKLILIFKNNKDNIKMVKGHKYGSVIHSAY